MFHRIVHANDGSDNSLAGLKVAIELAALAGASLDLLLIEEMRPASGLMRDIEAFEARQRRRLDARAFVARKLARDAGVTLTPHIFAGHPVAQVIEFTREVAADLLVIGATTHADIWEHLFGRRSDRMAHGVACSVLIAREGGLDAV